MRRFLDLPKGIAGRSGLTVVGLMASAWRVFRRMGRTVYSFLSLETPPPDDKPEPSLLKRLLDWEGVSFLTFLTIAFGLLALPHQYGKARFFFALAAAALALKIAMNVQARNYPRLLIAVLMATVAGMGVNRVNEWVTSLEVEENGKVPQTVIGSPATEGRGGEAEAEHAKSSALKLGLAPIVTIHRMQDEKGNPMRGGQYGLEGILRVENAKGNAARHVRSLQIAGDVDAGCDVYMAFYSRGDGSETIDSIDGECVRRKPFLQLSWISFPAGKARVDPDDEEFIRFRIASSFTGIDFVGSPKDYFGFRATNARPNFPFTSPYYRYLVEMTAVNPTDLSGIAWKLRGEVTSGKVKIRVRIDGELIDIPVSRIKPPQLWPDFLVEKRLNEELFYGIDEGIRTRLPSRADALVKPR